MKRVKQIFAGVLIAAMVTATGCSAGTPKDSDSSGANANTGAPGKVEKLDNTSIVFMTNNPEDKLRDKSEHTSFAVAVEKFEKKYSAKLQVMTVPYAEKSAKITAMIAAGSPPDLFAADNPFPSEVIRNMAAQVDGLIDFNGPAWKDIKDAIEALSWKGKHFIVPISKEANSFLWYNKTLFENNGLETPLELYKKGKWDWNTFRDLAIKLTQDTDGDKNIDQFGYASPEPIFISNTTGKQLLKFNNAEGTITNNLKDPDIMRSFTFFQETGAGKHNCIEPGLNAYMQTFAKGKVAMLLQANWADTVWFTKMASEGTLDFVPPPKDPESKEHTIGGTAVSYYIPTGAKNAQGAATFLQYLREATIDPEVRKISEDALKKKRGYTDDQVKRFFEINNNMKYTFDYYTGVGNINNIKYGLWHDMRVTGTPAASAVDKVFNAWQNEIDLAVGKIKIDYLEASAVKGTPKIDGDIDDAWKAAEVIETKSLSKEGTATAKVRTLWDDSTLYVLAEVKDDNIAVTAQNAHEKDSVEIFIDENNTKGFSYDGYCVQYRVDASGAKTGGTNYDQKNIESSVKKVSDGYIVEAAIKLKSLKPKPGAVVGFNVQVNDEENGKRDGTAVWNPDAGASYSSPLRFGNLKLK